MFSQRSVHKTTLGGIHKLRHTLEKKEGRASHICDKMWLGGPKEFKYCGVTKSNLEKNILLDP